MANTLTRGYTFGSTELVTNAKLHALVDNGTATIDTAVIAATTSNDFMIGDGSAGNKSITVDNGDANLPNLRYNDTSNKWEFSNDGSVWTEFGTGTGGATTINGTFNYSTMVAGVYTVISLPSTALPYTRDVSLSMANASLIQEIMPDNIYYAQEALRIMMGSYSIISNASVYFGYSI